MWRVEFTSDRFLPVLPEDSQVNPGAYGFELAYWLAQALSKRGVATGYPTSEDWGWLIEHADADQNEFTIGCSSMSAHGDGYKGQPVQWSVFIKPYLSIGERLKGVTRGEQSAAIGAHILAALEEVQIKASPSVD